MPAPILPKNRCQRGATVFLQYNAVVCLAGVPISLNQYKAHRAWNKTVQERVSRVDIPSVGVTSPT